MTADQRLLYIVVGVVVFFLLVSIRRRREAIRYKLRAVLVTELAFIATVYVLVQLGRSAFEAILGGLVVGLVVNGSIPSRSRHIPASVRRRKIAEYELRTGKRFNSQKYELDHEIPFSKGGSHSEDNLRVVEKKKNRSKGRKSPWWDLLGR